MAPSAIRALRAALKSRVFDRVYLFHGDDDFLKEERARELVERATESSTRDFNLDVCRGSEVDAASLAFALDSLPLMADRRVVVIRDAGALRKDARATLAGYLRSPAADVVLLLVYLAGSKPDISLLGSTSTVEFSLLGDDDLLKWVHHHAESSGATITTAAAELLCRSTGNDLALLAGELDKLRSFANGAPIDEQTVQAVVGVRRGETLGDLLEVVATRESAKAATVLEHVLAQPKTTGVSVLMALTTQTLAIGWALAARARGLPQQHLERELFGLLKENPGALVGRPWGDGVKSWVHALRCWDHASVERALELLNRADAALKDSRVSSDEQVLTTLVLAMTVSAPGRIPA